MGGMNARGLIERGLASYGRGELQEALGLWREALALDPDNDEAIKLVSFVEERMSAKTPVPPKPSSREPSPLPDLDDEAWNADEGTPSESDGQTAARLIRAESNFEDADEGMRKRRPTLVSMLPELLAPSTLPEDLRRTATVLTAVPQPVATQPTRPVAMSLPVPPPRPLAPTPNPSRSAGIPSPIAPQATRPVFVPPPVPAQAMGAALIEDGVPMGAVEEVITRQVEVQPVVSPSSRSPHSTDTPLDLALAEARDRGKLLVRKVSDALAAGKSAEAAEAAEDLLLAAEKSPAPGIGEVVEPSRTTLERAFFAHLGRTGIPTMAVDDATVNASSFDHRTGFLLSCIDGTLPIDTLIDISGMGRFEAARTLSRLLRRKIIKVG
jgi:tetratricopeptide (TPR) repeat protein